MSIYAVVPVKALANSKRRLSPLLNLPERQQLTLAMLKDVLSALQKSKIDKLVLIGNDLSVQEVAIEFDAVYLGQKTSGLNSAIKEATKWCIQKGAQSVLTIPADIPLLSALDVDRLIELKNSCHGQTVILCSSYNSGTNALLQSPPNLIPVRFGPRSFWKHVKEAQRKGVCRKIYYSTRVAMDIDSVADLNKMCRVKNETFSRKILDQLKMRGL